MYTLLAQVSTEINLDTVIKLPSLWVTLLGLLAPVVSAAAVHPSNDDNRLRWLITLAWCLAAAVVEEALDGSFTINEVISNFGAAVGVARFLSFETLDHYGLNDRILPSVGKMGTNAEGYKMVSTTGYEGGQP